MGKLRVEIDFKLIIPAFDDLDGEAFLSDQIAAMLQEIAAKSRAIVRQPPGMDGYKNRENETYELGVGGTYSWKRIWPKKEI